MEQKNIRLILQYDGSRYNGWQRRPGDEKTIQFKLENVISRMLGAEVDVIGSGRTDKGVHALMQVANFHIPVNAVQYTCQEMQEYINAHLPKDIAVIGLQEAPAAFHARFHCTKKTYAYRIDNREVQDVFQSKFRTHIRPDLDIKAMEKAASYFVGQHDFTAFTTKKGKHKSAIRDIYAITVETERGNPGFYTIRVSGNGFLYHMVRIIAGTLIEIGLHKKAASDIPAIFLAKERAMAGYTAPPEGLVLEQVLY